MGEIRGVQGRELASHGPQLAATVSVRTIQPLTLYWKGMTKAEQTCLMNRKHLMYVS